jgi:hypothetical protein
MKVMCIRKFPNACGVSGEPMPTPEVPDIDTVIDQVDRDFDTYYSLERFGMAYLYNVQWFAILPDQSADEMQEAEKEGIVNLEKAVV